MRSVLFLGFAAAAGATCIGGQCAKDEDNDAAALMQFGPLPTPAPGGVVFGTPLSGYHNVTVYVYVEAMKRIGFPIREVVVKYEHPVMYPMFLGKGGTDVCEAEGCPEKCAEVGLGYRSPCIDFVVDANIPVNHASYIKAYQDQYLVMGTAFETQYIALWAPAYTGWKTLDDAAAAANSGNVQAPATIWGQMADVGDGCDTLYCPKCPGAGYITGEPLVSASNTQNWTIKQYKCTEFIENINQKLDREENFLVQYWTPNVLANFFNDRLIPLDMYPYITQPNQGKALIRRDSIKKFTDVAYAALGAIYIGTDDVRAMDAWSHGFNVTGRFTPPPFPPSNLPNSGGQGPNPLCEHMTWDNNCALEAAQRWINLNSDYERPDGQIQPGVWESYFW